MSKLSNAMQRISMLLGQSGATDDLVAGVKNVARRRFTLAEVNAAGGTEFLPAVPGAAYRINDVRMIAVGANAAGLTTCDLLGTQATASVKLIAAAVANLTRSAVLRAGATGGTVLADGASFVACDENTALKVSKTGSNLSGATHIDVLIEYELV